MSILGKIFEKVLHPGRATSPLGGSSAKAAPAPAQAAKPAAAAPAATRPTPAQPAPSKPAPAQPAPTQPAAAPVDVEAVLTQMASQGGQQLNWRESIVDLLKLLDIDNSLAARKELAQELGYKGELNGSAEMNIWLHKAVMRKLAENGGKVPESLRD